MLRIAAALYSDKMTIQEVRAEVARILTPYLRDEYERRLKGKKKRKKRVKPPGKDGDDGKTDKNK